MVVEIRRFVGWIKSVRIVVRQEGARGVGVPAQQHIRQAQPFSILQIAAFILVGSGGAAP